MRDMDKTPTAEEKLAKIQDTLRADGAVIVSTYTRATQFGMKHIDLFKVSGSSLYARYGRKWLCIDYSNLTFGHRA